MPLAGSASRSAPRTLPHATIERHLVLLPLYVAGVLLTWQLVMLLSPAGLRDAEGIVKGHDFVQFYTLGTVARSGRLELLYDSRGLNDYMWSLVPAARGDTFPPLYGPQIALLYEPFSGLGYKEAVLAWLSVSAALYATAAAIGVALTRKLPMSGALAWLLLMLSPFLKVLLVSGQNSAFALLAICFAWGALEKKRVLLAGLALGTLVFKPQLLAGAVALCLLAGEWRLVAGAAVGAGLQLGVAWAWAGTAVMRSYFDALSGPVRSAGIPEPLPQLVHGVAGAARLLFGPGELATVVYLVTSAFVLAVAARAWRATRVPAVRVAILCVSTVLVCPHLYVYDLVILAPALLVCCDGTTVLEPAVRKTAFVLVWLAWFAPLSGPIALATRVQWSTVLLAGLLVVLDQAARQREISA